MEYRRGKVKDIRKRLDGAQNEYNSKMLDIHKEIATFTYPSGGYFEDTDSPDTHGEKRTSDIYDSIASVATRIATSGIASGLTPQTSRWGNWKPENKKLMESTGVRAWSDEITEKDFIVLSRSNFYKEVLKFYAEAFVFGTAAIITDFHPQKWINGKTLTAGEYYFLEDEWGVPDTIFRRLWFQAYTMEKKFGKENLSEKVVTAINSQRDSEWFEAYHVIQPVFGFGDFTYEGLYFEKAPDKPNNILMESGYFHKPCHIFKWQQVGSEKWGRSPIMEALPDIRLLHTLYRDKLQALAFMIKPLRAALSAAIKNQVMRAKPGDIIVLNNVPGFNGIGIENISRASDFPYGEVTQDMNELRNRINSILFGDLFQALSAFNPKVQTAFEISAIQDQNQRLLSPVIGNFISDFIIPQSERRYDILHRHGAFLEPPQELIGEEVTMEMTSSLSMIQQKVSTAAMERLIAYVRELSQTNPTVIDKIDYDQSVDNYANAVNAPGSMVRSDDEVKGIRDDRQEEIAKRQQLEEEAQAINNVKQLSETDTEGANALTNMIGV